MGSGIRLRWSMKDLTGGIVRFNKRFPCPPRFRNILLLRQYRRCFPGIHLKRSKDLVLENNRIVGGGR